MARHKQVPMAQQLSLITLAIHDVGRSQHFYGEGFGWTPVYASPEILFFQMNGVVLGLWLASAFSADLQRPDGHSNGFAIAHNVDSPREVDELVERLADHGGHVLRPPAEPPHGGRRGYVGDPDGHAWEIAWNPAWSIDAEGRVRFGL